MKKMALLLLCTLCIAACNNDRIGRGKFVKVLTDIYLYENEVTLMLGAKADSIHLYYSIFDKYSITKAQFDSTMAYYTMHPRLLKDVYENVNKNLAAIKDNADAAIAQAEIASNLWKGNNKYTFDEEGKPQTVDFNVEITALGSYEVSATARYFPDDSTAAPHMLAFLTTNNSNDTIDLKRVDFTHEDNEKDYSITFHIKNRNITHIKGYWLMVDDLEKKAKQHIQVHKLRIKKINTLKEEAPAHDNSQCNELWNGWQYVRYLTDSTQCHIEDSMYVRLSDIPNIPLPFANELLEPQPEKHFTIEAAPQSLQIQEETDAKNRRTLPIHKFRHADTARRY